MLAFTGDAASARAPLATASFPRGAARTAEPARATSPWSARWVGTQFRRTDDGAGGRLQTWRRQVKFWVRCCWSAGALQVSASAFRDSALDSIAETQPQLALRPLRSYLRRGLGARRRAQAVRSHFEWLATRLPAALIDRLYAGRPVELLAPAGGVDGMGVSLVADAQLGREGELALQLRWQGQVVMSLGFSVLDARSVIGRHDEPHARGARIVIGVLQGARGADAGLRTLAAASQRLRPSAILVLAVQALSQAWGLAPPLGVAAASHVYAGYASRKRQVELDYDSVWHDAGGERTGRHYWTLPAAPVLRPEVEVESRRRAQHRRRNALRLQLIDGVRGSGMALLARLPLARAA